MTLPYERASAGANALHEAEKILRKFGCANFGVMNEWDRGVVIVQFTWKSRRVSIEASWRGYAEAWLKEHPHSPKMRKKKHDHEMEAKRMGEKAAPSILRDWIKGQVTAVEMGLMPFEHAFMPHMLTHDGTRLVDRAVLLLEAPNPEGP